MIAILFTSRTGSSMVAGIFAAHGLNYGGGRNAPGYFDYEYPELKEWLGTCKPDGYDFESFVPYKPGITGVVNGLDMMKVGVQYWPVIKELNPKAVKVKRNLESAARSVADKRGEPYDSTYAIVKKRFDMLDSVPGVEINTDELVNGDLKTLREAFDYCDLDLDEEKAMSVIKPDRWHY